MSQDDCRWCLPEERCFKHEPNPPPPPAPTTPPRACGVCGTLAPASLPRTTKFRCPDCRAAGMRARRRRDTLAATTDPWHALALEYRWYWEDLERESALRNR